MRIKISIVCLALYSILISCDKKLSKNEEYSKVLKNNIEWVTYNYPRDFEKLLKYEVIDSGIMIHSLCRAEKIDSTLPTHQPTIREKFLLYPEIKIFEYKYDESTDFHMLIIEME